MNAPAPHRAARRIELLVIHCSATPNGRWVSTLDIDHWHAERGFKRPAAARARQNAALAAIGYHWVIYPNGGPATGRHPDEVGAHAKGHNAHSLGLCLVGTDRFTPAQWQALAAQVEVLCGTFGIPRQLAHAGNGWRGVCGHRDLSPDINSDGEITPSEWLKTCPGFDVAGWLAGGLVPLTGHLLPAVQP